LKKYFKNCLEFKFDLCSNFKLVQIQNIFKFENNLDLKFVQYLKFVSNSKTVQIQNVFKFKFVQNETISKIEKIRREEKINEKTNIKNKNKNKIETKKQVNPLISLVAPSPRRRWIR
jgi:hypothetical protein